MVVRHLIAIVVIGLAGFYAMDLRGGRPEAAPVPPIEGLPREVGTWRSADYSSGETVTEVLAADRTLTRRYQRADGATVMLFLAYFAQQQVNSQIHSPINCLPGGGWRIVSHATEDLVAGEGATPATCLRISREGHSQEVVYWFQTQGGRVAGEYALKWDLVKNAILRRPTNAAFVRYNAASADAEALHELVRLLEPHLNEIFGEVGLQ